MKEKKVYYLILLVFMLLMTACSKELDNIVVPVNRTAENLHTNTENLEIPALEVIPDTEVHFKDSNLVVEKKF